MKAVALLNNAHVVVGTGMNIAIKNTDHNDHGAFDPATNLFTAPATGTYVFGASLL